MKNEFEIRMKDLVELGEVAYLVHTVLCENDKFDVRIECGIAKSLDMEMREDGVINGAYVFRYGENGIEKFVDVLFDSEGERLMLFPTMRRARAERHRLIRQLSRDDLIGGKI